MPTVSEFPKMLLSMNVGYWQTTFQIRSICMADTKVSIVWIHLEHNIQYVV